MRAAILGLLCAGCAPSVDATFATDGAKTALIYEPLRELAFVRDLSGFGEPVVLPLGAGVEVHLFAEDVAELRISATPAVIKQSTCKVNELETQADLCVADGTLVACALATSRMFARLPFENAPCFVWRHGADLALVEFNLEGVIVARSSATTVLSLGDSRLLLGQQVDTATATADTIMQVIDTSPSETSSVPVVARVGPLPGYWGPSAAIDASAAWISDLDGRVARLDIAGSTLAWAVTTRVGVLTSLARSPADADALLGVTSRCSIVLRDGASWVELTAPVDTRLYPGLQQAQRDHPCNAQVSWDRADEALVVGASFEAAPMTDDLKMQRTSVVRVRGDRVVADPPLTWPTGQTGILTAVGAYTAEDGTRVEVAVGFSRTPAQDAEVELGQGQKLWFVHDPRRGDGWVRLVDPDETNAAPIVRLTPFRDGLLGVGGFQQAFSDAFWRVDPSIALSQRDGRELGDVSIYDLVASDGHRGYVMGASRSKRGGDEESRRFVWRKPRRMR